MTSKMPPMVDSDDPDRQAEELMAAFKSLHKMTVLEAFMKLKRGELTQEQFSEAFDAARLTVESGGRA